jgi:hypothetical protein
MASRRRQLADSGLRSRRVPARSRVTVRRSEAPLLRSATLSAALRDGRSALTTLEGELEAILRSLRTGTGAPEVSAADRLRGATAAATAAMASLGAFARR